MAKAQQWHMSCTALFFGGVCVCVFMNTLSCTRSCLDAYVCRYSWRLCPKGNESEECFLHNTLDFDGNTSWIRYAPIQQWDNVLQLPDFPIPALRVTQGTYPPGSMWTREWAPLHRTRMSCDNVSLMTSATAPHELQHFFYNNSMTLRSSHSPLC